jgi:hypothetical protein
MKRTRKPQPELSAELAHIGRLNAAGASSKAGHPAADSSDRRGTKPRPFGNQIADEGALAAAARFVPVRQAASLELRLAARRRSQGAAPNGAARSFPAAPDRRRQRRGRGMSNIVEFPGREPPAEGYSEEYVDKLHAEAFRDLEGHIGDCVLMASIAVQMAEPMLGSRDPTHEKAMRNVSTILRQSCLVFRLEW